MGFIKGAWTDARSPDPLANRVARKMKGKFVQRVESYTLDPVFNMDKEFTLVAAAFAARGYRLVSRSGNATEALVFEKK